MKKEAYDILGINRQQLGDGEIDLIIRGKFRERLSELLGQLNEVLNNNVEELVEDEDENDTDLEGLIEGETENNAQELSEEKEEKKENDAKKSSKDDKKLRIIDKKIQAMFQALFAYMKVMTRQAREENEKGALSTVEEDMKDMRESLKRTTKIEYRTRKEGPKTLYNAYQILGIPEKSPGVPEKEIDEKIERKTLMRMQMKAAKKIPYAIEEIMNMLFVLQGEVWAYSKIRTAQNRTNYSEELNCQRIRQESRKFDLEIGVVRREVGQNPVSVPIHQTEQGEIFSIANVGKLINRALMMDEGVVNQYALERDFNGEKSRVLFYGKINMKRLETDPKYAEFWQKILFSETTIPFARKYLAGYVGEAKSTIAKVDGEPQEILTLVRSQEDVAICRRHQEDTKRAKRNGVSTGEQPPQGGDIR